MTAINSVQQIDFGLTLNVKKAYDPLNPFLKKEHNYPKKCDPDLKRLSINESTIRSRGWQR